MLFLEGFDVCNFADDSTIYVYGASSTIVSDKLEISAKQALDWFKNNSLVTNPKKFQVLFIDGLRGKNQISINIDDKAVISTDTVQTSWPDYR